jgi:MFS family permease
VLAQTSVLLALVAAELQGVNTPLLLIAAASAYHLCAQLVAGPWSAWMGDIVPARIRGRYFSGRTRAVHLTTFVALLGGGALLQWLEPEIGMPGGGRGFALLYGTAAVFRFASAVLLASTPEGTRPIHELAVPRSLRPRWNVPADRLAIAAGLLFFAVYFGSPFFTPYMLEELHFDYVDYTLVTAAMVGCKVLALRRWGRAVDRFGAAAVYRLAIVLQVLIPLPWLLTDSVIGIALSQGFSGFAWAAHEIGFFSLVLEHTTSSARPRTYALQSISTGLGQLVGSLVGGLVLMLVGSYLTMFAMTSALRFLAASIMAVALAEVFRHVGVGRRRLLLRVMGLRPSGGVIHRPLD